MSLQSYGSENLAEIAVFSVDRQGWNQVLRGEKLLMRCGPFVDVRSHLLKIGVVLEGRQQQALRGIKPVVL